MPKRSELIPRQDDRIASLKTALAERILVLDGAMGTAIQSLNLSAADFGGEDTEGCNEILALTRPDWVESLHRRYLEAGCDIVETNTFGGTPLVLAEYGLADRAIEINRESARLARRAADALSTSERLRWVAGSMGPTTKAISVTGGVSFEDLIGHFHVQARGLLEGGADFLLLETCQDTRNVKAGLLAIDRLSDELGRSLPVAVSGTIEASGTMLGGQGVEALLTAIEHRDLLYIGLNCATGPEFMTDHIRTLARLARFPLACVPNAGLPDENGCYLETPETVARVLSRFLEKGWLNLVGGCCGTHFGHVRELAELVRGKAPRKPSILRRSALSGVDYLEITDELRPVVVGERTNVIGSRKFRDLIKEERFEEATDIARGQVKGGAQLIDVCLANPDRNELEDMRRFLDLLVRKIRAPLMIDSTDEKVIEAALTYCQGKAIINSVNLEDGEERFDKVVPLARRFGAALVVGTIDDDPVQGMGVTLERKLAIAEREHELLTKKRGIPPEDIYWDPLVFPCGTGDAQYVGSAPATIQAVRALRAKFPGTRTVLGISNVSFGLPPAGREVLNSVFLYECVQSGLDLAIVNSEKLVRYAAIPEEERKLSLDLLYNRGADPVAAFAAHFRQKGDSPRSGPRERLPLMDRLPRYIVEGSKDGLVPDLDEALKSLRPLDIINGPLMKGMDEVGRLFNANQLIVAEVLQSAEAMKAAVAHLEPHMEKNESALRGKVVLATVKGDVHDIGKNLVEIILANNGFKVVNLGIKVPPEQLIQAAREHRPDIIGLSGLLVKSAQQMVSTVEDFARADVRVPVLVGGAALTENFVDRQIAPSYASGTVAYARDAMAGLDLAKTIVDSERFVSLKSQLAARRAAKAAAHATKPAAAPPPEASRRSAEVPLLADLPPAPDLDRHALRSTPVEQIWRFINPLMLYGRHLGIRGGTVRKLEKAASGNPPLRKELETTEPKAVVIWDAVQAVKEEFRGTDVMRPLAVYQFFRASSEGNRLMLAPVGPGGSRAIEGAPVAFDFPRQRRAEGLCLADYVQPTAPGASPHDTVALFVTSAGRGVRALADQLKDRGDYLKSHILQALAIETAEAYAEWLHAQLRKLWGFPDPPDLTMMDRFQAKYRGKRYSFGYPACPRLDDQRQLFELLRPEEIGVDLTDGFMMDPEASVSALVFHHPQTTYFSVGHRAGQGDTPDDDQR